MRLAFLGNFGPSWSTENHLAGSFELAGHEVTRIQEGEIRALDVPALTIGHDLFVWTQTYGLAVSGGTLEERYGMLAGIKMLGIPSVGFHLDRFWDLDREDQIAVEPWFRQDIILTADGGNQDRFAAAGINHRWTPPGVYEPECVPGAFRAAFRADIAFVGSWRGHYHAESKHRFELVRHLQRKYRTRVRFWPRGRQIRGQALSDLYASVKIVVGDSCFSGLPQGKLYCSDRIPEVLGRGGFLLHPHTEGVTDGTLYTAGEHLACWNAFDWDELDAKIAHYLSDAEERSRIAATGREHVLAHHTYTVRARQILEHVFARQEAAL